MSRIYVGSRGSCIWGKGERRRKTGRIETLYSDLVTWIPEPVPLFGPPSTPRLYINRVAFHLYLSTLLAIHIRPLVSPHSLGTVAVRDTKTVFTTKSGISTSYKCPHVRN
jgi:hypothetical protein